MFPFDLSRSRIKYYKAIKPFKFFFCNMCGSNYYKKNIHKNNPKFILLKVFENENILIIFIES